MQSDFEFIKHIVDRSNMSDDDKKVIKTSLWTAEQIPKITSPEQYETYAKIQAELSRALPDRSDPDFGKIFVEWTRSREGILATTYRAKMIEWEDLNSKAP
jgi:hypothetical protein